MFYNVLFSVRQKAIAACFLLLLIFPVVATAQEIIPLYPNTIPNSKVSDIKESRDKSNPGIITGTTCPTLECYLPEKEKATGTAVVVCPGGGYSVIVYQGEGVTTAKEFARHGVAAFILKYRLPNDLTMSDKHIGPLQDAQQAIKVVRENASKWDIDPARIGIMGFSAGGHLASTEATHYNKPLIENDQHTSLRPDFQIVVYPVISMQDSLTQQDTRNRLLGNEPSQALKDLFSNEMQVDSQTPAAYITHAADDKVVDVDNSIRYFEALRHHNVPVEMHLFPKGGHGFVFGQKNWMEPLFKWMENSNLMKAQ
ncbi:MAG: alpha/beta hydrolase [Bacteroidota bacterium]|nr:alpha/beta hydrolase [Bacteroidota bacterium]